MIALTRDFHIVTARVTTRFSAELFSIGNNAKAWYVRAHFLFWIRHYDSRPSFFLRSRQRLTLNVGHWLLGYDISIDCMQISKPRLAATRSFQGLTVNRTSQ